MSLAGWKLATALIAALSVGALGASFASGWRSARGLPALECVADAGVQVGADAGTSARSDCAASIEHWNTVTVPGPTRYVYVDGGVRTEVQTVTVLVPDLRLSGASSAVSTVDVTAAAQANARAQIDIPKSTDSLIWGAGPGVQHDDAYRPTLGGELGYRWEGQWVKASGNVDPLDSKHWNGQVFYGGSFRWP